MWSITHTHHGGGVGGVGATMKNFWNQLSKTKYEIRIYSKNYCYFFLRHNNGNEVIREK